MDDAHIRKILTTHRTVAVYGCSTMPEKPAHYVPAYLQAQGYEIIPINPGAMEILGVRSHAGLADVPGTIEILDVFRPPRDALGVALEAVERRGAKGDIAVVWLQLGIRNEEARDLVERAGITFVQDRCMLAEHKRLALSR